MTIDVYVAGLNEIGASIACVMEGLGDDVVVTGFDPEPSVGRAARKAGMVSRVSTDMLKPARSADLVFLSLPTADTPDALNLISPVLKEDAVVFDLAPLKGAYVNEVLKGFPAGRTYVGAVPALNPDALLAEPAGPGLGSKDLFDGGSMALVISPKTPEEVVNRIMGIVSVLGAEPYFVDAGEVDGMTAVVREIPILASAAYLYSLTLEPGWKEARRLASREFYSMARLNALVEPSEIARELLQNRKVVQHRLQNLISSLEHMKKLLDEGEQEQLESTLEETSRMYASWYGARKTQDWSRRSLSAVEMPSQNLLASLLGIRPRKKK